MTIAKDIETWRRWNCGSPLDNGHPTAYEADKALGRIFIAALSSEAKAERNPSCQRDCGCIKPKGHDGRCNSVGPLPEDGCTCDACKEAK